MQAGFIKCQIVPGMFSGERGVIIHLGDDRIITSYVDKADVIEGERSGDLTLGKLRVFVREELGHDTLVYLPRDTTMGGRALIISHDQIEYVPT